MVTAEPSASPSILQRTRALVELARPGNTLMAGIGVVIGAIVVGLEVPTRDVVAAMLATMLVVAGGNAFNDITDLQIDRVAHPDRPLPRGHVTTRAAIGFALAALLVALALAVGVSFPLLLLVLGAEAMLVAYEMHLKASGVVGNLVVALLVGATFFAGALAVGTVTLSLWLLAGLAFLANVGRELWKDCEDATSDTGRRTLARVHGQRVASTFARVVTAGAIVVSPLPWLVADFGGPRFLIGVALADALFLAAILARRPAMAQRLSKLGMMVALVAFTVGALA